MYSTAELKRAFNIRDLLENSLCRTCPTQNSRMNTFNQAFAPQPTQHPISTQFSMTSMANSSIQYETTTLSPQNSMTQLPSNTSGPAFNYPTTFSNHPAPAPQQHQPYMVPMGPVYHQYPQIQVVPGTPTTNMSPPQMFFLPAPSPFQTPSPIHFANTYPQQPLNIPYAVGEYYQVNGQYFPVLMTEGLQVVETQSQHSSGSSEQTSCQTPPQQISVQPPTPPSVNLTVRTPPGFHSKSLSPPHRGRAPKMQKRNPISWSQRVNRKKPQVSKAPAPSSSRPPAPPKRQPSRVKKASSTKVLKNEGRKKRTKYGYRSKQNKIDTVHENLEKRYTARGILADKEEVLRGPDVLRLHVKKFDALTKIEQVLETAEKLPGVSLKSVSIPLSMKNEFQKKGFLVYCQLSDANHVEKVKRFFQGYSEFSKCQIALPNLDKGEPDHPAVGEPEMNPVETGSPELAPMEKTSHPAPLSFDGEKDTFTLDDEETGGLDLGILPMLKNASLASVGC